MATSKLQRYVSNQLSIHFGGYTIRENHRPDWLNSGNGGNLELDFFIEEIDLAIEVQGKQHWQFVPMFHGDRDGYNAQIKRDKKKKEICLIRGIKLVEVFTKDDINSLIKDHFYIEPFKPEKIIKQKQLEPLEVEPDDTIYQDMSGVMAKIKEDRKRKKSERIMARKKDFIRDRVENLSMYKKTRALNRKLKWLRKNIGIDKFDDFMKEIKLPDDYLNRLFPGEYE